MDILHTITPALSTVTVTGLGYITWYLKTKVKSGYASEFALKMMIRSQLRDLHSRLIKEGSVTFDELEDINDLFEAYKKVGGNSTTPKLVEELNELPKKVR